MFGRTILLLLLLSSTQDFVKSLRLVQLRAPTHKREGGKASLSCQYDLEGDTLYSIKWYKDGHEFYRYMPSTYPSLYHFPLAGINIDTKHSSANAVTLVDLTQETAGNYSCEVNGDAPRFYTVIGHKYLHVYLLPKGGPRVVGLKEQYNLGDSVVANCTLAPSRPMPVLTWYINAKVAPNSYVSGPWYRVSAERPDAAESILQLSFNATEADFINGTIKLKYFQRAVPAWWVSKNSTYNDLVDANCSLGTSRLACLLKTNLMWFIKDRPAASYHV